MKICRRIVGVVILALSMSAVVFPIKYTKLGASAKEFLKFVQYDHSTNRLKMAKSLEREQNFFFAI